MSSSARLRKVKIDETVKRNFSPAEIVQLQEMQRLVNGRKFEAAQIKSNTALIPRGKEIGEEIEAIARVLENVKNQYVGDTLLKCGYPSGTRCDINYSTGEVILHVDEGSGEDEAMKIEKENNNESTDSK